MYGPFSGFSSYPVVMRGLLSAFRSYGLDPEIIDISIGGVGDYNQKDTRRFSLGELPEGAEPGVFLVMNPTLSMLPLIDKGCEIVGFHVGDVSEIPENWLQVMKREKRIVVPSSWMKYVVEKNKELPSVFVANHGIEDIYLKTEPVEEPLPGAIKFLHFCSSASFPERKGTPQAISAFKKLKQSLMKVELTLVVPEKKRPIKKILGHLGGFREDVLISERPYGVSTEEMINLYKSHHILLCPSRAEGFGLMPLEARALGVPVVQTLCTGMLDHPSSWESAGVVVVPTGSLSEAWGDFGEAPSLSVDDVAEKMKHAVENYDVLQTAAKKNAKGMNSFSWTHQTVGLANLLKGMIE